MVAKIRMTHSTAMVLQALASGHGYGFDIMDTTGLPGGIVGHDQDDVGTRDRLRGVGAGAHQARNQEHQNRLQ
jgi:hypothetical protein